MNIDEIAVRQRFEKMKEAGKAFGFVCGIGFVILVVVILFMVGCPQYQVYEHRMNGEALLAKSMAERKVQIQDAEGKKEAATYLAGAEVERAKGVAQANKIIGDSLKDNESYLRWLWIEGLKEKGNDVIYIPTEAGLPILEASRFNKTKHKGDK